MSRATRRGILRGGSAMVLALAGCGGGGGGGTDNTAVSPSPAPVSGAPAGAFGGGGGQIATRSSLNKIRFLDLASRTTRRTFDQGTDSSLQGVTAALDGTHCAVSRPAGSSNIVRVSILRADASLVRGFEISGSGFVFERTAGVVSPDGRQVAIGIAMSDAAVAGGLGLGICVVDVDGGNRRLVPLGQPFAIERSANPAWLPDGRLLVQTNQTLYLSADASVSSLPPWRALSTTQPGRTTVDRAGTTVFFDQVDGINVHLWKYDIATAQVRQLTTGNFRQFVGAVSPDGRWLMFFDDRVVLINGVPNPLATRADYLGAIPVSDQLVDLGSRDMTLRDGGGNLLFELQAGSIGWI